jgi:hypothetical protein
VRRCVRKWVARRRGNHYPDLHANIARHADTAGDEVVFDPHLITDLERVADGRVVPPFRARQGQPERSFGQSFEIFPGYDTFSMHTVANPVGERS